MVVYSFLNKMIESIIKAKSGAPQKSLLFRGKASLLPLTQILRPRMV